eukprot:5113125-Amphidinium_carterae.1
MGSPILQEVAAHLFGRFASRLVSPLWPNEVGIIDLCRQRGTVTEPQPLDSPKAKSLFQEPGFGSDLAAFVLKFVLNSKYSECFSAGKLWGEQMDSSALCFDDPVGAGFDVFLI